MAKEKILMMVPDPDIPQEMVDLVYIDHEELTSQFFYANNFKDLMTTGKERGNKFIKRLNA